MHIAVKDLVEQRKPLLLGHPQADLDERPAFDLFLVVSGFAQGTVAAIEVGVGDVIDDAGGPKPILAADLLEESPLPGVGVQGFQAVQGAHQPPFGQPFQVQEEVQIGALEPSRHEVEASIVQTVSVDQTEDFLAVASQLVGQLNFVGQVMEHEQGTVEFDLFDFDFGKGSGEQGLAIGFAADIADMALHAFALDPFVFDFGQVNPARAPNAADEAHSGYNIHYDEENASRKWNGGKDETPSETRAGMGLNPEPSV